LVGGVPAESCAVLSSLVPADFSAAPIRFHVNDTGVAEEVLTWTFQRRNDRLTIQREYGEPDGLRLVVTENGRPRIYTFTDLNRLVVFQRDMEDFLVRTGWSLAAFAPDRRSYSDRRRFPRVGDDRRRWWTDVPPAG
jgi:hypothetical protein